MGLFDWFSSGTKAADKILDAGIKGIDAVVYTQEERAEMRKALGNQWLQMLDALGKESTVRSITRRVLAFITMGAFTVLILAAAVVYYWDSEYAKFLLALAESKFGWLVVGVGAFYFGPHMLGRLKNGKK